MPKSDACGCRILSLDTRTLPTFETKTTSRPWWAISTIQALLVAFDDARLRTFRAPNLAAAKPAFWDRRTRPPSASWRRFLKLIQTLRCGGPQRLAFEERATRPQSRRWCMPCRIRISQPGFTRQWVWVICGHERPWSRFWSFLMIGLAPGRRHGPWLRLATSAPSFL